MWNVLDIEVDECICWTFGYRLSISCTLWNSIVIRHSAVICSVASQPM